jgi:hypothetical protein
VTPSPTVNLTPAGLNISAPGMPDATA